MEIDNELFRLVESTITKSANYILRDASEETLEITVKVLNVMEKCQLLYFWLTTYNNTDKEVDKSILEPLIEYYINKTEQAIEEAKWSSQQ